MAVTAKSPKALRGFTAAPFDGTAIVMQSPGVRAQHSAGRAKASAGRGTEDRQGIELRRPRIDPAPRIIFANFLHGPVLSAEILPFPSKGVLPRSKASVLPRGMVACCANHSIAVRYLPGTAQGGDFIPQKLRFVGSSSV